MYCPNCKEEFQGKFCPECGTKMVEAPKQKDFGVNISDDAAIMGGVNVTRNESHNTTIYNTTIADAKKSDAELHQERTNKFLELCKHVFSDGLLDDEEKIMLATERLRLGLSEDEANRLIEMARRASVNRMNTLSMRDSMTLKTIDRYIYGNNAAILKGQVPRLAALARNYKIEEVLYRYYMLMAALCPEELICEYERDVADDYWQTYWVAIAYMKKGDTLNAEDAIVKLDVYPEYSEDNSLLLSALSTYRVFGAADATEFIGAILPDQCSSLLMPFIQALFFEITPERAVEVGAQKDMCQFYLDNIVNLESPEEKAAARKAAEEVAARKAAEEAAIRKAAEEAAARKATEEAAARKAAEGALYDVILKSAGDQKLKVITAVKLNCGVSLVEAKDLVYATPCTLKEGLPKADAEAVKKAVEEWGAVIELRISSEDAESRKKRAVDLYNTGDDYYYGRNGREKNLVEAAKCYRKSAELGYSKAQNDYGYCCKNGYGVDKNYFEAVKWYRKAAEQNNSAAHNNLGNCYQNGLGVNKDYVEAVKWYRKSAELGNSSAQFNLGFCYKNGYGVNKDDVEAVKWYLKAAEQGNSSAQINLGICYKNGYGVNKDMSEAAKWYRKAAERGNSIAQYNLGNCYQNGCGVDKDYVEAVKWYLKAAEQGDVDAQYNLGSCYKNGYGVNKDMSEAAKWYRKAAEQGYADAQYNLGYCYDNGCGVDKDYVEAVKWYLKAAEQGDASAQNNLGYCYRNGNGVNKDDVEAAKWYLKAAERGNSIAQNNLGYCYQNGCGVDKDYAEAVKWYRKAAEQGNSSAQNSLGYCYRNGNGVNKDDVEAVKWYRKAAERGNSIAQYNLGYCYQNGYGVNKDISEAVKWFRKAAEKGHEDAKMKLKELGY